MIDITATNNVDKAVNCNSDTQHPATIKQKIILAIWLTVVLAVLIGLLTLNIQSVDNYLHRQNRVPWEGTHFVSLKPGPPVFRYDNERKELVYIGVIDAKMKLELLALFPTDTNIETQVAGASYAAAIDKLAFESNEGLSGLMIGLLCLGGLSGALGSHLRSQTAFVGNACFKNNLDLVQWWPYYVVRPFTGFILGIVVVVIVQAGFFSVGNGIPAGTLWWAAVAILAGYGDDEFTQKLRQLTKTLFGKIES
ncbi:MAG: hypothetical protein WC762_01840 [Methylobacter sp.]|jgi:hypothetical protein